MNQNIKNPNINKEENDFIFYPFTDWSDGEGTYYGYVCNQKDFDIEEWHTEEWHIEHLEKDIYKIEYAYAENCSYDVYRGKIPTRDFFISLMRNFKNAPEIDWQEIYFRNNV